MSAASDRRLRDHGWRPEALGWAHEVHGYTYADTADLIVDHEMRLADAARAEEREACAMALRNLPIPRIHELYGVDSPITMEVNEVVQDGMDAIRARGEGS